ncbi:hypothetical protein [Rhodoblastus sp.]|uniref:hypothetical protein n=1 Tax=Rhodoblastus sp. TaxID=1962975 RepID=UPI003F9C1B2E
MAFGNDGATTLWHYDAPEERSSTSSKPGQAAMTAQQFFSQNEATIDERRKTADFVEKLFFQKRRGGPADLAENLPKTTAIDSGRR